MGTFKSDLSGICKEVAREFQGWSFVSDVFKNKTLEHTELQVAPCFGFKGGDSTPLQPTTAIFNKKAMALSKQILGTDGPTSVILFRHLMDNLNNTPENLRGHCWIVKDKQLFMKLAPSAKEMEDKYVDISEARPVLKAMLQDGILILQKYFNLSGEEGLLNGLPPKYVPSNQIVYDEMERHKGVMVCIVRILLGDFDFVERYASDDFVTTFPKRRAELDKVIAALPDLKRRYAETGSVI
jgi:hypothetical protein